MDLGNLERRSRGIKVVELPGLSTEERLRELGAIKDGYEMIYENLGVVVCWRRVLDEDLRETNLYGFYSCKHAEEQEPIRH